jgi:hypothetical protein
MTTVVFKNGQFQTEDGICFEDQTQVQSLIAYHNPDLMGKSVVEGSTYSIREKIEVVDVKEDFGVIDGWSYKKVARIVEPMSTPEQESDPGVDHYYESAHSEPSSVDKPEDLDFECLVNSPIYDGIETMDSRPAFKLGAKAIWDSYVVPARKRIEELEEQRKEWEEKYTCNQHTVLNQIARIAELEADRDKQMIDLIGWLADNVTLANHRGSSHTYHISIADKKYLDSLQILEEYKKTLK